MATFYWIGGYTGHTGANSGYDIGRNVWTNWMTGSENTEGDYVYGPYAWDIKENWLELDEVETRLQADEYDSQNPSPSLSVVEATRFPGQNITGGNDVAVFGRFHGRMWRYRLDPVTGKPTSIAEGKNWYWHDVGNNISCLFGGIQGDGFTASGLTATRAGQTSGISVIVERNWINGADILHPSIIGQQLASTDTACAERQDHSWTNPMRFIPTDTEGKLADFVPIVGGGCIKEEKFGVVDGSHYRGNNWTAIYGNHANMFRTGEIGLIKDKRYGIRPDSTNTAGATGGTSNSAWLHKFGHVLKGIQLNLRCANITSIDKPGRAAWPMAFESFPIFNDTSSGTQTSSKLRYGKLGGVPYQRGYNTSSLPGRVIWAYGTNTIQKPTTSVDSTSTSDLNGVFWKDGFKVANNFVMEEFICVNNVMDTQEFTYSESLPYTQSSGFVKIIREDESESPAKFATLPNPNQGLASALAEGPYSSTYVSGDPVKYYTFASPMNYSAWQRKYSGRHVQLSGAWGSSTEISSAKTELLNFSTENLKIENARAYGVFIDKNSSMATIKISKNRYMINGVEIEGAVGSPHTLQSIEINGGWENQSRKYDIGITPLSTSSSLNFNQKPYWTEANNNVDNCIRIGQIYQTIGDNIMVVPSLSMKTDSTFAEELGNPNQTWTEQRLWFKPGFNQSFTPNLVGAPIVRLGHVQIDNLQLLGGNLNVRTDKVQYPPSDSSAVDCVIREGNVAGQGVAFMMGDVRRTNDSVVPSGAGPKGGSLSGRQGVRQLIVGFSPGDNGIVFEPTQRDFCSDSFLFVAPSNHTLRNAERYAYITNSGLTATGT